jgi:DNA-directed RNA polymerase subunit RPC12/RpoP
MKILNVSDRVITEWNDDENLPITQCVCGHKFPAWDFIISVYRDNPTECPKCGAKLFWSTSIKVFQVINEDNK